MAPANLQRLRDEIASLVREAVASLYGVEIPSVNIERPPRVALGDLALPVAFDLARALKRPPRQIAAELAQKVAWPTLVLKTRVEGAGYLNLFLDRNALVAAWLGPSEARTAREGKVVVEHTNINPNKAAHIGHLRNAVLGDVLVRALRFLGYEVEVQNYIDDTGVQVADVVVGFYDLKGWKSEQVRRLIAAEEPEMDGQAYACFGDLCWDLYAEVGRAYAERPELQGLRAETLHAMELHYGERAEIARSIVEAIVREHVATMGRLGVAYDLLPRESDILKLQFWARAFDLLKEKGAVILETGGKNAGCWVMKLSESEEFAGMDEPDKILVRSNGTVTYTGKDIAYQLWKFGLLSLDFHYRTFTPDWSAGRGSAEKVPEEVRGHPIWQTNSQPGSDPPRRFGQASRVYNVIDVRQSYPQKVVREGLRALGFGAQTADSIHYAYEMVALTPAAVRRLGEIYGEEYRLSPEDARKPFVEMSGRKGLGVKGHDLMLALFDSAREEIGRRREREGGPASAEAVDREAWNIAVGALRYFMLKYGRNKIIAFDFEEALNFEGDSGPYLQYAAVRADNIFRKLREAGLPDEPSSQELEAAAQTPWEDDLWSLLLDAASPAEVVEKSLDTQELGAIARHTFSLAQAFNQFYHRHPILHAEDPARRARRLAVARVFRREIGHLLGLLGIPTPERM